MKKKENTFFDVLKFCFGITYKTSKKCFWLYLFTKIITVIVPFADIIIGSKIIDYLVNNTGAFDDKGSKLIYGLILLFVFSIIFQYTVKFMSYISDYIQSVFNEMIDSETKQMIMKKTSSLKMYNYDNPEFFDSINDVNMNCSIVISICFMAFNFSIYTIQFIIAMVKIMFYNWYMPLIIIATMIPAVIIKQKQMNAVYGFQVEHLEEARSMYYVTNIALLSECAQDIRMYGLFPFLRKRFLDVWELMFNKKKRIVKKYTLLLCLLDLLPLFAISTFMILLGINVFKGNITIGEYNLNEGMIGQAAAAVTMVFSSYTEIYDGKIRVANFRKFLSRDDVYDETENKDEFSDKKFTIEFRNVSFKYYGCNNYVLNNISFKMDSDEKIALVGVNGSGKTSIIKLLLRLYEPDEGEILINGKNVNEYTIDSIRKCFSPMFQNYFNYAFKARDNISLSALEYENDFEKIVEAAKKSGAHEFIDEFEDKYETYLSRQFGDGRELSGGQWQKVALARAFFRNAEIYILDEPSAALDAESEDKLIRKFEELYKNKGAILVSHRLSNVRNCDRIIVIEEGILIEEGTHQELMELDGKYAYMYNLQAQKYL